MLRNSTKKYKAKYQPISNYHYGTVELANSKPSQQFYRSNYKQDLSTNLNLTPKTINIRKTQQSSTFNTRTFKVRTKQSLQNNKIKHMESTKLGHRRQLTSPINKNQIDEESIYSLQTLQWNHKDDLSVLERDGEKFIENMKPNTIFYCCSCFHYIFSIQKNRHYPQCKDALDLSQRENPLFRKLAWSRLQKIVQLSRYTKNKVWQIEQLFTEIKRHQFSKIFSVSYPKDPNFFTLQQIIMAFVYTYQYLLKGVLFEKSTIFSCF